MAKKSGVSKALTDAMDGLLRDLKDSKATITEKVAVINAATRVEALKHKVTAGSGFGGLFDDERGDDQ